MPPTVPEAARPPPNASALVPVKLPQPERAAGRPRELASYRVAGSDTCVFHRSGIDVEVRLWFADGRIDRSTLPSAPPSYESWNVSSADSEPPRLIWRTPRDAPRSTFAAFGLLAEVPPRRRMVTGSLKFTSDARLMNDFLLTMPGFFLTC